MAHDTARVYPLYALIGMVVFLLSAVTVVRTRPMLRFRSPGTVRPGSISDRKVQVWRLIAGVMAVTALAFSYVSLFVL